MIHSAKIFIPKRNGVKVLDCETMIWYFYSNNWFEMKEVFNNKVVRYGTKG